MPQQKPGRSKQDYATPDDFIRAIEKRFGKITIDLAASEKNAVCRRYIDKKTDSLKRPWPTRGILYLNPPYRRIAPWVKKCSEHRIKMEYGSKILVLVPASIATTWFEKYVLRKALIKPLQPRITFKRQKNPYPKDLMLLVYEPIICGFFIVIWKWK
jgi:phage N-6-adenine-methyltransferase